MHLSDLDLLSGLLVLLIQQLGYELSLLITAVSVKYIQNLSLSLTPELLLMHLLDLNFISGRLVNTDLKIGLQTIIASVLYIQDMI